MSILRNVQQNFGHLSCRLDSRRLSLRRLLCRRVDACLHDLIITTREDNLGDIVTIAKKEL